MSRRLLAIGTIALASVSACGSDSTHTKPAPLIPDFIYVSNQNGGDQLFTYVSGTTTLLPGSVSGDMEPQSAHGRIVFAGYRASPTNSEIYSAKIDGSDVHRLTTSGALDLEPTLSPDGATIVFTSQRSGTSRLWSMHSDGSNQTALTTGSESYVPESAPRFSPDRTLLLFNSSRTGTAQLFITSAAGGESTQLTHELNGAFDGSWDADGTSAFYIDGENRTVLHEIQLSGNVVTDYVSGGVDIGQEACNGDLCLVVRGRTSAAGNIYAFVGADDHSPMQIVSTSANERQPAFLMP